MTRKFAISVITTSRADYGLLKWPLTAMRSDPDVDLKLIVGGSHLEDRHGNTIEEIQDDGFKVFATAPMYDGNSFSSTVGLATTALGIEKILARINSDFVLLLGDRFEILGAAAAVALAKDTAMSSLWWRYYGGSTG